MFYTYSNSNIKGKCRRLTPGIFSSEEAKSEIVFIFYLGWRDALKSCLLCYACMHDLGNEDYMPNAYMLHTVHVDCIMLVIEHLGNSR